jgi:hypothetical protein
MGLDENDLTRPPEKWTPAMLSFVEYTAYGPRPVEEDSMFIALDDLAVLEVLCARIVSDVACEKELQQWCDGKNKVYKFFLSRALEATESKAPVALLKEALNKALSAFRAVDDDSLDAHQRRRRPRGKQRQGDRSSERIGENIGADAEGAGEGGGTSRPRDQDGFVQVSAKEASRNRMRTLREMDEKLSIGHKLDDDDDDDGKVFFSQ